MPKYLITGGSGFIGTHVVQALISAGHEVLNLDSATPKIKNHVPFWKECDICSPEFAKNVISYNPQFVIHLAARTDLRGKTIEDYSANTVGVVNLLNALEACDTLRQVVFASSMYVCEPGYQPKNFEDYAPHTVYGESKVLTEKLIKERDPKYIWSIIRPTSIWGPHFGEPYNLFFKIVLSKKYFHLGSRACVKTYGYIDNAVVQIMSLFENPTIVNKGVYYIGDYEPYNISEWADEIGGIAGLKIPKLPFFAFRIAGWVGDSLKLFGVNFPMTSFRLKNMTTDNVHDLRPIKKIVPHLPTSRGRGSQVTVEWMKNSA